MEAQHVRKNAALLRGGTILSNHEFERECMDTTGIVVTPHKRFHFEFLLPLLFRPGATFQKTILKRATWLTPLLVISLLTIARVMLATPAATTSAPVDVTPPPGIQIAPGKGQELQGNYALIAARPQKGGGGGEGEGIPPGGVSEPAGGSITANIVPALMATVSIWAGWFLLSILLYVGMVVSGSNNSFTETLNLVAWASLPLGLHQIVVLVAVLARPTLGDNPAGLAALASSLSGPLGMFLSALLKLVDVYLIWQVILIVIGLRQVSPLTLGRIWGITLGALALFLILAAMPGFLTAIFAQLTAPVPSGYGGGYGG